MAEVTISAGTIEHYSGGESTLKLRIYCNKTFGTTDSEVVQKGKVKSANFYKELDCTIGACMDGGNDCINVPEFTIDSTTDGGPDDSSYTFALFTPAGSYIGTITCDLVVPPTPTPTTLGALLIYSADDGPVVDPVTYTKSEVDGKISAIVNAAIKANSSTFGVSKLSVAPASLSNPIAMGVNDPVFSPLTHSYYLEKYATLALAIAAIGSTQAELIINCPYTESTNITIPANILVRIDGAGLITVANTKTLTIRNIAGLGDRQYFTGSGRVLFDTNACADPLNIAWWAGISNSGDITSKVQQIVDSLILGRGGRVYFGSGVWKFTNITWPNHTQVFGVGAPIEGATSTGGTVFALSLPLGTDPICKVEQSYSQISFTDIAFHAQGAGDASCFRVEGVLAAGSGFNLHFTRCCFIGGLDDAPPVFEVAATGGDWEVVGTVFFHCTWLIPKNGFGFVANTVNSTFLFIKPTMIFGIGATGIQSNGTGWVIVQDRDFRAAPGINYDTGTGEVFQRTQHHVSYTNGDNTVTITPGTNPHFTMDDLGQNFTGTGIPANNYFIEIVDEYEAKIYIDATSTQSDVDVVVNRQGLPTSLAHSGITMNGNRGALWIQGGADEGLLYSYKFTASTAEVYNAVYVSNASHGGRVLFEGTVIYHSKASSYPSLSFRQSGGLGPYIDSDDVIVHVTTMRGTGSFNGFRILPVSYLYANYSNSFQKIKELQSLETDVFTSIPVNNYLGAEYKDQTPGDSTDGKAVLSTGSTQRRGGVGAPNTQKVTFRIGSRNPETLKLDFFYDMFWDDATGYLYTRGNHPLEFFRGNYFADKILGPELRMDLVHANTLLESDHGIRTASKDVNDGIGYSTGAGVSAIVQPTSRATNFTCTGMCGIFQTNGASLAAGAEAICTITNASVGIYDHVDVNVHSAYVAGFRCEVIEYGAGTFKFLQTNVSAGAIVGAVNIKFYVKKGVVS